MVVIGESLTHNLSKWKDITENTLFLKWIEHRVPLDFDYEPKSFVNVGIFLIPELSALASKKLFRFEHLQNNRNFAQLTAPLFMDGF